jgi:multidrug efflux pump subunit AcrA (membrane-fusion protein)
MTRSTCTLLVLCAALAAAACSSGPAPTAELSQAHSLVDQAEQSGAPQYASADLATARSKLQQADLDAKKEPALSLNEAQEATADARVALARTNAAKAQAALRDVNAGTQALQNETERTQMQNDAQLPVTTSPMPQ